MKKKNQLLLAVCAALSCVLCGSTALAGEAPDPSGWPRDSYYMDESEQYMLSITYMDDTVETGWYVGCMLGEDFLEDSWGGFLPLEENTLRGTLPASGSQEDITVTVSEEGEGGALLEVEGGETYHFLPMDLGNASIFVTVNTEGLGNIDYAAGEEAPEIDTEYPYQSAQINLEEPTIHTFVAWPQAGNEFVKWTRDGEDFSTEPQITVLLDESADYVAVFEEDAGWQNPVMNFIGPYSCGRANATVECDGADSAWITIDWSGSAAETAHWDIFGRLDPETLAIEYSGCTKSIITYAENGNVESQEPEYEDGTGTITFHEDGSFTWHEDQSETGEDLVFEWAFVAPEESEEPEQTEASDVTLSDDSSDFVLLSEAVPDAILEIRYYSTYNFVGDRIDGYEEPLAFLTKEAAAALREVSDELVDRGYRLKIFDAYRPQMAVTNFMNWALDTEDTRMKEYFYPELEKDVLFPQGYIAEHSGHSRGSTVDLTLFDMTTEKEVDMGGTFGYFGELSHPDYTEITEEQYANRMLLREVMVKHGFKPLVEEWWHFTLEDEPYPDTYFTFPINSDSLE